MPNQDIPQATSVAEKLLGVSMDNVDAAYDMVDVIESPDRFYDHKHKKVAEVIFDLVQRNDPVDPITVADELDQRGDLVGLEGSKTASRKWINDLAKKPGRTENARHYGQKVVERWVTRTLLSKLKTSYFAVQKNQDVDADRLLSWAQEEILNVGDNVVGDETKEVRDVGFDVMQNIIDATRKKRSGEDDVIPGVSTGFPTVDQMIGGWEPAKVYVLAGRPGHGKTSLILKFLLHAAQNGHASSIFSLEMSAEELISRVMGQVSGISTQKGSRGLLSDKEIRALNRTRQQVSSLPFHVHDDANARVTDIRSQARRDVRKHDIDIVAVDYLQLMGSSDTAQNREREIANISRSMKLMAKELGVAVLLISQLNRSVESRGGMKRPQVSDLRESGAIEQDADVVSFVYRPEMYDIEKHDKLEIPTDGIAEYIIGKQRNGPVGTVYMDFDGETTHFEEMGTSIKQDVADEQVSSDPRNVCSSTSNNGTGSPSGDGASDNPDQLDLDDPPF